MTADSPGMALALSGHIASTRIRKALARHGLKPAHGHVLRLLSDQGPTSQQSLLETLGVDPSMLVTVLNDLEADGLVERRRDPADRRRHIVEISTRGRTLAGRAQAAIAAVEAALFAGLDADEIATLRRLLARVTASAGDVSCSED
ncbi:MarR family winged helix-turn-helix transcriptional regulator [Nonomuraea lactucae]|uniref:MarR family winged helix-turn-helix transcriptional regulator n=1 Tax=Nonomuraea lactucae TaxID=2249762 RepID=UPI001963D60C|nr:MarR family winged helix-turn-helix transcriptional regulator [Nonomuraea lactucae]